MAEYTVKLALKHNEKLYVPGSTVDLTDKEAPQLIKLGVVDPEPVAAEPAAAEAQATDAAPVAAPKTRVPDLIPPGGPAPAEQKAAK